MSPRGPQPRWMPEPIPPDPEFIEQLKETVQLLESNWPALDSDDLLRLVKALQVAANKIDGFRSYRIQYNQYLERTRRG